MMEEPHAVTTMDSVCSSLHLYVTVKALKIAPASPPNPPLYINITWPSPACVHLPAGPDIRLFTTERNVTAYGHWSVSMFPSICGGRERHTVGEKEMEIKSQIDRRRGRE